jgi:carboxyl-terminal processing protease
MKVNRLTGVLLVLLVATMLAATFLGGMVAGRLLNPATARALFQATGIEETQVAEASQLVGPDLKPISRTELFQPFWQAWDIVHDRYIDQPVDDVVLMRGAIQGMLKALGDEHTSYLDPDLTKHFEAQLKGETYEGIGAWVDPTGDYLKIISPMPGSPAEQAGLKPGDLVVAVNGEDMTGIDGEMVRQRVIGPKGSMVTLTIQRNGVEQPFDVEVRRDSILVPTVESKMLENNVAYVRLYTFGDSTADDLHKALKELMSNKPSGLILDLRYNGGGYLGTAIDVASEFISDGVILYEETGDGNRETFKAKSGGLALDVPMIVLVNEGSASASEIVSGAIQDHERGKLLGVTSYGKGSVQIVQPLANEQGEVRVTIAHWLTPNGRQINKVGLEPDVTVEMTDADRTAGLDPQLDRAIQLLSGK